MKRKRKENPLKQTTKNIAEDSSEIDERDVDFKKDKVNLKDKSGKERENSDKIDGQNQLSTINKERKGDVNERSCNNLDESD